MNKAHLRPVVVLVLVAVLFGLAASRTKPAAPVQSTPSIIVPAEWAPADLVRHLNGEGLKCRSLQTGIGTHQGPTVFILLNGAVVANDADGNRALDERREGVVYCTLLKTEQEARDRAGTGSERLAIGRFALFGNPGDIEKIKAVFTR